MHDFLALSSDSSLCRHRNCDYAGAGAGAGAAAAAAAAAFGDGDGDRDGASCSCVRDQKSHQVQCRAYQLWR